MALFSELIASGKIQAAYSQKKADLAVVCANIKNINDLDKSSPKGRIFSRYESDANKSLEVLKGSTKHLTVLLFKANPEMDSGIAVLFHNTNSYQKK